MKLLLARTLAAVASGRASTLEELADRAGVSLATSKRHLGELRSDRCVITGGNGEPFRLVDPGIFRAVPVAKWLEAAGYAEDAMQLEAWSLALPPTR